MRIRSIDAAVDSGNIVSAKSLNNNMSCTCPIETCYKNFFEVYLNSAAVDSACNASQLNTLWNIAQKCPFQEGDAVYRARNLLRHELDSNIFFDADCTPDSLKNAPEGGDRVSEKGPPGEDEASTEKASFEWRPNPTDGRSTLLYDLGERKEAQLQLMDLQGRTLKERSLHKEGKLELELSDMEAGLYLYRIQNQGELLESGRLVLID